MEAIIGDRVQVTAGMFADGWGIFVGERDGQARIALDEDDVIVSEPFESIRIHRPLLSDADALRSEIMTLKLDKLRAMVTDAESQGDSPASRILLDLVPALDVLPLPEPIRAALAKAAADAIHYLVP